MQQRTFIIVWFFWQLQVVDRVKFTIFCFHFFLKILNSEPMFRQVCNLSEWIWETFWAIVLVPFWSSVSAYCIHIAETVWKIRFKIKRTCDTDMPTIWPYQESCNYRQPDIWDFEIAFFVMYSHRSAKVCCILRDNTH